MTVSALNGLEITIEKKLKSTIQIDILARTGRFYERERKKMAPRSDRILSISVAIVQMLDEPSKNIGPLCIWFDWTGLGLSTPPNLIFVNRSTLKKSRKNIVRYFEIIVFLEANASLSDTIHEAKAGLQMCW